MRRDAEIPLAVRASGLREERRAASRAGGPDPGQQGTAPEGARGGRRLRGSRGENHPPRQRAAISLRSQRIAGGVVAKLMSVVAIATGVIGASNAAQQSARAARSDALHVVSIARDRGISIEEAARGERVPVPVVRRRRAPSRHRPAARAPWRRRLRVDGIGPTLWLTLVTDIGRVYSRGRHSRAAAQSDAAGGEPKLFGASRPVFRP